MLLQVLLLVLLLFGCKQETHIIESNALPIITGETSIIHHCGIVFNPVEGITAYDQEDGNLTSSIIIVSNNVDIYSVGFYTVDLQVTDSDDNTVSMTITVEVIIPHANYLEGIDLSKLPFESKSIIYAALEEYLLENVYGGVPLFRKANHVIFSNRTQLFSPEFNGLLGFGIDFSQFTADDSSYLMYGDEYGKANEYTWRDSYNTDPFTLNPWIADDSATSDFIDRFTGGLYDFYFDASKTGYELNPSLASTEPIAIDPEIIDGKTYSKIWQIPIRDNLTWKFHPETDTSSYDASFEILDASDYLWTWETAMTEGWFRAISGGGDFISHGVKNAAEFINGTITNFDDVGLRLANGETNVLEIEFITEKSAFEVKYMFFGASLSPINQELFEATGGTRYGLTPQTVASSGVYYLDTWNSGESLLFTKNDSHPDSPMYHYNHYQYRYIDGADQIFEEFIAGRLDSAPVPPAEAATYFDDPRVFAVPDSTTWSLNINAFGTVENRDAYIQQYPDLYISDTWEPEPILMYLEMRQALYYGFDRYEAAVNVAKTYLPAYTLYAPTYFFDSESGMSVRGTDAGAAILDKFGGDTYGYLPNDALGLFKNAIEKAIEDGYYEQGTSENYNEIILELFYSSNGNFTMQALVFEMKRQYEELLVDDDNFINIIINVHDIAFPSSYYDPSINSNMDLSLNGISSSYPRYPAFDEIYGDTNSSGFTFNWGIDTHTPNIEITYNNIDAKEVTEIWSYNALVAALKGKAYIREGEIQTSWENIDSLIDAFLDMNNEVFASSVDGSEIARYVLKDTLESIASENDFDNLISKIVTTESGASVLFIVSIKDSKYELYSQTKLFTNVEDAIKDHSGYSSEFVSAMGPLSDAEIASNEYISDFFPEYNTLSDVASDQKSPLIYTEVWAIDWDKWSDAYVVLHIGDYYLGWIWL